MHKRKHSKRPILTDTLLDRLLLDELKNVSEPTPKEDFPLLLLTDFVETLRRKFPPFRRLPDELAFARVRTAAKRLEALGHAYCVEEEWTVTKKGYRA